jgi:RNA polymerase sigma factor (sigma-70 family)
MPVSKHALEAALRDNRASLLAFIRSKVRDEALAEDILQDSLLRALRGAGEIRNDERVTSWLYGIARNAITDTYRRRGVREAAREAIAAETDVAFTPEDEARLCACMAGLVPTLKPEYARVVQAELNGEDTDALAAELGITKTNLKVRRHRAHHQLRERLEQTCLSCAAHGCIDCSCAPARG